MGSYGTLGSGDTVCFFGRTTGYHCATAWRTSISFWCSDCGSGATLSKMAQMYENNGEGGDSGRPYFDGSKAWGIHHGEWNLRDVMSYVSNANAAVKAVVLK